MQADDATRTEAEIRADLEWLLERGYVGVEWLDDDGNVLPVAAGLH